MSYTCEVVVAAEGPLGLSLEDHVQGTIVKSAGADKSNTIGHLFASLARPTGEGALISLTCPLTTERRAVLCLLGKGPADIKTLIIGSGLPYTLGFQGTLEHAVQQASGGVCRASSQ